MAGDEADQDKQSAEKAFISTLFLQLCAWCLAKFLYDENTYGSETKPTCLWGSGWVGR